MWSAGDDKYPLEPDGSWARTDTAEIYSPPYLFKGPRPKIVSAPSQLSLGRRVLGVDPAVPADSAVLVAPGATTHGADSNQRVVKLAVKQTTANRIDLVAPPTPASRRPATTCSSFSTRACRRSPDGCGGRGRLAGLAALDALRRRLLLLPGGFEGFIHGVVLVNPHDPVVLQLVEGG